MKKTIGNILKEAKNNKNIVLFNKTMIDFTYNSNRIEGVELSYDQVEKIIIKNKVFFEDKPIKVNDVCDVVGHVKCFRYIVENYKDKLTETFIKKIHSILKDDYLYYNEFSHHSGEYKQNKNIVGNSRTCAPPMVSSEMKKLLRLYNSIKTKSFEDIVEFHVNFEKIHPFQDGNGRVGRLIMFKECLANNIIPFIIEDEKKVFYYRGIKEWGKERGYLLDTCLSCQDDYKEWLKYFKIQL